MKKQTLSMFIAFGTLFLIADRAISCTIREQREVNPAAQASASASNCAVDCPYSIDQKQYSPQEGWRIVNYRVWTAACTGYCSDPGVNAFPANYNYNYAEANNSAQSENAQVSAVDPNTGQPVSVGGSSAATTIRNLQIKYSASHPTIAITARTRGERAYGANGKHTVTLATTEICTGTPDDYRNALSAEFAAGRAFQLTASSDSSNTASAATFAGNNWGNATSQQISGSDDMRGWSWNGSTTSYLAVNPDGKTILYIRSFDGKNWGTPTSQQVSGSDDMRGWSWNGSTASYLAVNPDGKTILYIRSFDGKNWGTPTSQQVSGSDDMRGWSWNGSTTSYLAVNPDGKTILYIRSFDGKNWGTPTSQQVSGSNDMRGWSWNGSTASYLAVNPSGQTILYIRPLQ